MNDPDSEKTAPGAGLRRLDDLITDLRRRARRTRGFAMIVLALLVVTIFLGLGWYIGWPLWQQYQQSGDQTAFKKAEVKVTDAQNALDDVDAERDQQFYNNDRVPTFTRHQQCFTIT